jgi:hypothetical protein
MVNKLNLDWLIEIWKRKKIKEKGMEVVGVWCIIGI